MEMGMDNECRDPMNNNKDCRVGQLTTDWVAHVEIKAQDGQFNISIVYIFLNRLKEDSRQSRLSILKALSMTVVGLDKSKYIIDL